MKPIKPPRRFRSNFELVPFIFLFVFTACSYIAPNSQFAYEQTISTKGELRND